MDDADRKRENEYFNKLHRLNKEYADVVVFGTMFTKGDVESAADIIIDPEGEGIDYDLGDLFTKVRNQERWMQDVIVGEGNVALSNAISEVLGKGWVF